MQLNFVLRQNILLFSLSFSLPEVPPLPEVSCVFVDLPDAALQHLQEELNDYGRVLARAPVQITEVSERPGGLLIKWAEVSRHETRTEISQFSCVVVCPKFCWSVQREKPLSFFTVCNLPVRIQEFDWDGQKMKTLTLGPQKPILTPNAPFQASA